MVVGEFIGGSLFISFRVDKHLFLVGEVVFMGAPTAARGTVPADYLSIDEVALWAFVPAVGAGFELSFDVLFHGSSMTEKM